MSFKLTPITAKIQKTTKGGITNPFIKGVGVPMKEPAVAKLDPNITSRKRGGYKVSEKKPYVKRPARNAHLRNANKAHLGSKPPFQAPQENKIETVKDTPKPAKITGKIGSDLRRKQYDAKGWAYDDTIKKPKAKVTNTNKVEKEATIKPTKNVSKRVSKKLTKAAKAVDEGRDKKADRLYKRAARIENREIKKDDRKKARAAKKKAGQASKAINPNS